MARRTQRYDAPTRLCPEHAHVLLFQSRRRLPLHEVRLHHFNTTSSLLLTFSSAFSVHVPAGSSATSRLPVFVWLHGGSFVSGSAGDNALDGSILAEQGKMIVITIQYRLGVFGFLNAPSLGVSGNMGVLDIVEALCMRPPNPRKQCNS